MCASMSTCDTVPAPTKVLCAIRPPEPGVPSCVCPEVLLNNASMATKLAFIGPAHVPGKSPVAGIFKYKLIVCITQLC